MQAKTSSRKRQKRSASGVLLASFAMLGVAMGMVQEKSPARVDFGRDVQPILQAHCTRCHSATTKFGDLGLDSTDAIFRGGASGKVVVPHRSAESLLIDRVTGKGGKPTMPMGFGPLSATDVATLRAWIDEGCVVSASGKRTTHWAYLPPVRPPLPVVRDRSWIRNPIDSFVLAKLEKERLRPSPEADRTTLIRRVTLDLIGLPPTPEEVDEFVADRSPNAYERVVDRLLASPHYGERMALPWLDAARYADSNGFQMDGDNNQYVWRDWVVNAMNANMPFDRFTIEQLAGDLLPNPTRDQIVATGFNRNHMLNGEGGAIVEEQRNVILFDRVDTTATTWMGLTMACARCHDHKYDPLTQRDYYSLMAYFNNVPETGIPPNEGRTGIADPWIYAGSLGETIHLKSLERASAKAHDAAKPYEQGPEVDAALAKWETSTASDLADPAKAKGLKLPDDVAADLKAPVGQRKKEATARLREYFLDTQLTGIGKVRRLAWHDLDGQISDLHSKLPRVMVMSDKQPRETHILSRGNYTTPLEKVGPGTPAALPMAPGVIAKDRLGLAKWLVSSTNPLTARVQVNRYWQLFFGGGLVRTPENFGVQGEAPTHPELLDWLAVDFRESGWDVKRLQRMIVTSATYRQSSKISREMGRRDPDNRLLARGSRFRLPSALLRDVALQASGLLYRGIGGKPVYPYQPKGIWDGLNITDERDFSYPQSTGLNLYRRSLYTFWRRTVSPGDMFDASSRQVCTVRLSRTSTPLHALTTLNDVTWVEAGRALAQRVMTGGSTDPDPRLSEAFRRVCARRPNAAELKILRRSLDRALESFRENPDSAKRYLAQGESPIDPHLNPVELAAFATACLAILNLDEALTRE